MCSLRRRSNHRLRCADLSWTDPPVQRLSRCLALGLHGAIFAWLPLPSMAQDVTPARVIVKLKADSPLVLRKQLLTAADGIERADKLATRIGRPMRGGAAISERAQVVFATGLSSRELADRLAQEPDVEYAVPDRRRKPMVAPNDPLYPTGAPGTGPAVGQWYLRAPEGPVKSSINAEAAWAISTGNPGIVVAVLDTGIRFEHPDLLALSAGGNLLPGYDMIADVDIANDGDGRDADASDPGDWLTADDVAPGTPFSGCGESGSSWHGTQVAGVIAALTDNGQGMASVGRTVRVLPVRVLGRCGGFDSDILAGIRWAAGLPVPGLPANDTPARVINLSLGGEGPCTAAYQQAVDEVTARGTVIVAAGGNSAGHAVQEPANCPSVIGVAGLRHAGTKVGFSDLGPEIAVSAPGGNCVNVGAGAGCLYPILTTSNGGATTPGASIYTDSFNVSVGTSFAVPLVSGTAALMLSANASLAPVQVRQVMQATARLFPSTGVLSNGAPAPRCTAPRIDAFGNPIDQLECVCTTSTCGAGIIDAGAAVLAASTGRSVTAALAEGLWWTAPGGSESGWGLNIAQQGDVIFATWFTYDTTGKAWWLSMSASNVGNNIYSGTLHETRGPAFDAVPWNPTQVTTSTVGDATLAFSDAHHGTFSYTVNGVPQVKSITRVAYGDPPSCTTGLQPDLAAATNYQDIWWSAPGGSESGWGINLIQQSNIIFATWFTYDQDGSPLWLSMTAANSAPGVYAGTLYRTTGPAFSAVPFNPALIATTPVGMGTLSFANGNSGTFAYTVNGVSQVKPITRTVFRPPGTVCR